MKISGKQIAMARILVDLSQKELADKLGIARKTIMRIENGQSPGSTSTTEKIQLFFENNGLEFLNNDGVQRSSQPIRTLKGSEGLKTFLDEVYEYASENGGTFYLHNAQPQYWYDHLSKEWYEYHAKRMTAIKEKIDFRIITEEGNTLFISSSFAEYRWFPKDLFADQPIYSYADKIAFTNFDDDNVVVSIFTNEKFAKGFQSLFNIAWDQVAIKIPKTA